MYFPEGALSIMFQMAQPLLSYYVLCECLLELTAPAPSSFLIRTSFLGFVHLDESSCLSITFL